MRCERWLKSAFFWRHDLGWRSASTMEHPGARSYFGVFLLFDRAAGLLPPRPWISGAVSRRSCQGRPSLRQGGTLRRFQAAPCRRAAASAAWRSARMGACRGASSFFTPGDIIPECRATSSRNGGRLQIGTAGGIIPEWWAASPGIRRPGTSSAAKPILLRAYDWRRSQTAHRRAHLPEKK